MGSDSVLESAKKGGFTYAPPARKPLERRADLPHVTEPIADSGGAGHDFGRVQVARGDSAQPEMGQCPITSTPRTCPFGGACHTCPTRVQAKLEVGAADDEYEREADRIADEVVRMPEPHEQSAFSSQHSAIGSRRASLSRVPPGTAGVEVTPGVETQIQSLRRGGQPLPDSARRFFEPRFRRDFGQVRLHTDGRAAEIAGAVKAAAFTVGADIVFGSRRYAPYDESGQRLLAHELTHVVQQGDNRHSLMRSPACDCAVIGRDPTDTERASMRIAHPGLTKGNWCVAADATAAYNCIAWTIGVTDRWIWSEVDSAGDKNGILSISDFDAFYRTKGLRAVENQTPANPEVALYADGTTPTHAARKSDKSCPGVGMMFESKLGQAVRIVHPVSQLEGGFYGDVVKYYVRP